MSALPIPKDLAALAPWFKLIRRLIAVARSGAYGIVTIQVVTDADGSPRCWSEPTITRLEPKWNPAFLEELEGGGARAECLDTRSGP